MVASVRKKSNWNCKPKKCARYLKSRPACKTASWPRLLPAVLRHFLCPWRSDQEVRPHGRRRQGNAWSSCRQIAQNSMSRNNFDKAGEQPFINHLIELRNRLLRAVLCVLVIFLGLASSANEIYSFLAGPLMQHMPKNSTMIAIDVASPFFHAI